MKKILASTAITLVCLAFSGCQGSGSNSNPQNISVNSDGTCTQQLVADVNDYGKACVAYEDSASNESLRNADAVCKKFTSTHAQGVECTADSFVSYSSSAHLKDCFGFKSGDTLPSGTVSVKLAPLHQICAEIGRRASKLDVSTTNSGSETPSQVVSQEQVPSGRVVSDAIKKVWIGDEISLKVKVIDPIPVNKSIKQSIGRVFYWDIFKYYDLEFGIRDGKLESPAGLQDDTCNVTFKAVSKAKFSQGFLKVGETFDLSSVDYDSSYRPANHFLITLVDTDVTKNHTAMTIQCVLSKNIEEIDHIKLINDLISPYFEIKK